MATLDYKIASWSRNGNQYTVHVKLYRGAVTTEQEPGPFMVMEDVTRWRRTALVAQRRFTFQSDLTPNQLRKWLNKRIRERIESLGHTIADFQTNTAQDDTEVASYAVSNLTDDVA